MRKGLHKVCERIYYSLTHPQKRIWYIENIYPEIPIHNIGGAVTINSHIDFDALEEAINIFISKHDGLRIRIVDKNGDPQQYVSEFKRTKLDYYDLSSYHEGAKAEYYRIADTEMKKPFKLLDNPLFFFALFKLDNNVSGYFIKLHHIISDGWSIELLTRQIMEIYTELIEGREIKQEKEQSYIDYIKQEKVYLGSEKFIKNKNFWNNKFTELPEEFSIKSSNDTAGERQIFYIGKKKTELLKEFCAQNKCSLYTFFTSLLLIYLSKITSQEDIIIGTPVLNRSGKKEKSIFGMFTSTMPLRANVNQESTAAEFIRGINSELMDCFFNQKYPYDLLVKDLELKKKGLDSLFQVSINYYNTKMESRLYDASIENMEFYSGHQSYPLQLIIKDWLEDSNLSLSFDYKLSEYTSEQIKYMYYRLDALLDQIVSNPSKKILNLHLVNDSEWNWLVYGFNSVKGEYPSQRTIYELFEEQAERTPNKIAVIFDSIELTYKELNERSNSLARYLRELGVGRDRIVGLMSTHSHYMVIGILAIIKAGGAYLPIDSTYPAERIEYIVKDSDTSILLTDNTIPKETNYNGHIINLKDENLYKGQVCNLEKINKTTDLVYVIYTSGSTGAPKGVMVEHRGLVNYIWWAKKMYVRNEKEVFPLYTSLSFDLTVTSIFTPLISGNTIVVYYDDGTEFILLRILRENKVSIIKLTPVHLSIIKDMNNDNSSVKRFIVGGEDLKVALAHSIYKSFGGDIEIFNEYGPTETVVGCMIHKYDVKNDLGVSVPIGIPADNIQIYILDKNLNPVPVETIGELYVSGAGVTRGYLNREELTKERFVDNPFIKGSKMYKTGDLAKHLHGGEIVYMGRSDYQVKLRGYRIELGEIENYLLSHNSITDAIVIDRNDEKGNKYLCAYIVSTTDLDISEIRVFLSSKLPDYMLPSHFVILQSLPLTSNGKVDRKLLPEPKLEEESKAYYCEFENDTEEKIIKVICEVLGIDKISPTDNFYQLGGDSIKAIQIASRLKSEAINLKVKDILLNTIIGEFVERAKKQILPHKAAQGPCEGSILPTPITQWFFRQKFNNENHYNQSVLLDLKQNISLEVIETALGVLVKQHDSLRINYDRNTDGLYYNNKYTERNFEIKVCDLSSVSQEKVRHEIKVLGEDLKSGMDIEKDILFKAYFFKNEEKGNRLLLTAHHLVIDAVSWRILLDDFSAILKSISMSETIKLPPKSDSMQKWAETLKIFGEREVNTDELKYWENTIENDFVFPVDFQLGEDILENCDTITGNLSEEDSDKLTLEANRAYNTVTNELLFIALSQVLSNLTQRNRILIELEGHGRENISEIVDISRTVGWFTSIYPVSVRMDSDDLGTQIRQVKEQLREVPRKGIGFGVLSGLSQSINEDGRKHIRFNFLGELDTTFNNDYFKLSEEDSGSEVCKKNRMTCLIDINAMIIKKRLSVAVTYSRNSFKKETIERLLDNFLEQIRKLILHCCNQLQPDYTPSDFELINISQDQLDDLFD